MRKAIFTLAMFVCSISLFAQHSMKTALELVEGQNSYTLAENEKPPVIWKFHAGDNAGAILKVSDFGNLSVSFLKSDSTTVYGYYNYNEGGQYYPVAAGEDIFVSLNSFTGATEFKCNVTAEWDENVGHGYSVDDAVTIVDGKKYMFCGTSSGTFTAYMSYTPTESGVLELYSSSYLSSSSYTADGKSSSLSFNYSSNGYIGKVNVEKGKKYDFTLSSYSAFMISAQITHPTIGSSYDLPFTGVLGSNILPAAAGTYWYAYTCDKAGYMSMASDATLQGGTVKVYSGSYTSYSSPVATFTNTLDGKWECSYANTSYLIKIEKNTASGSDETFTLDYEDYKEGETESNPIQINELPTTLSTGTSLHYYYSVDVPESAVGKFLIVEATSDITNSSTQVYLYKSGSYSKEQGNKSAHIAIDSSGSYLIHWQNKESQPISFSMSYEEAKAGDTFATPAEAKVGDNTFNGEGVRFYQFTASVDGRVIVTPSSSSIYVSFPKAATGYDTWPSTSSNGKYTLDVTPGTTYVMKFSNVKASDTFNIEEGTYAIGESEKNPIIVETSPYTLSGNVNVWLKYVAPKSGVFVMKGNLPYSYSNSLAYKLEGSTSLTTITQSSSTGGQYTYYYEGSCSVQKGTTIYMNIKVPQANDGDNVEFSIRDFNIGEDASNPFIPRAEEEFTIPTSYKMPQWIRMDLDAGELNIVSDVSFNGKLYYTLNNVKSDTPMETFYSSYDTATGKNKKTFNITNANVYYLQIYNTYSEGHFSISGKSIGSGASAGEGGMLLKDAEPLVEGRTEHKFPTYTEGQTAPIFFKYTAPNDMAKLLHIVRDVATSTRWLTADSVEVKADDYITVDKGQTIYLKAVAGDRTLIFDTEINDYPQYGKGYAEDNAITTEDGGVYFFDYSNDERKLYFKYTAKNDGTLNVTSVAYCTGTYREGDATAKAMTFTSVSNGNVAHVPVSVGNTYDIVISAKDYNTVFFKFTETGTGSTYYKPFIAVKGENTVPKEAGTYWYKYAETELGNLVISSACALPGGRVEIYSTEYQAAQGSTAYVDAVSKEGSYNTKIEVRSARDYYICVKKAQDSEQDDVFTIATTSYNAGQSESDPILITEFPCELEVEGSNLSGLSKTTYYAIDTPVTSDYFVTISTKETLSDPYTYVFVYKEGAKTADEIDVRTSAELVFEKGSRYLFRFVNREGNSIKYTIDRRISEQGDTYTNPLPIGSGENTISTYGKRYYKYTATVNGKLILYVSSKDIDVTFPSGPSKNDRDYKYVKDNLTYTIDVTKDKEYVICLNNVKAGDTFEVSERKYETGEDKLNPADITDTYTFDNKLSEVWLRYTCKRSGMFTVESDLTYSGLQTFEMSKGESSSTSVLLERKVGSNYIKEYRGRMPVEAGDIVYLHISMSKTNPGKTVTVDTRDVRTGESIDKPIVIAPETKYTIPAVSMSMPVWCKLTAKEGSVTISASNLISGYHYTSYEKAQSGTSKESFYAETDNDYTFNIAAADAGDHYLMLHKGYVTQSMTITGDITTGISTIASGSANVAITGNGIAISGDGTHISIANVGGMRIADETVSGNKEFNLPAGIYIIEIDGKCQKVVIR